jgi:hypothetical protein
MPGIRNGYRLAANSAGRLTQEEHLAAQERRSFGGLDAA